MPLVPMNIFLTAFETQDTKFYGGTSSMKLCEGLM